MCEVQFFPAVGDVHKKTGCIGNRIMIFNRFYMRPIIAGMLFTDAEFGAKGVFIYENTLLFLNNLQHYAFHHI